MDQREIPENLRHRLELLLDDCTVNIDEYLEKRGYFDRDNEGKRRFSAWVDEELDRIESERIHRQPANCLPLWT
jgi:hypothetical protein